MNWQLRSSNESSEGRVGFPSSRPLLRSCENLRIQAIPLHTFANRANSRQPDCMKTKIVRLAYYAHPVTV